MNNFPPFHYPTRTLVCFLATAAALQAAPLKVSIDAGFPGGNIVVKGTEGNKVYLAPDMGTSTVEWFYWYFSAETSQPGKVEFIFKGPKIGVRGPAYSLDNGKTWQWLGANAVNYAIPKQKDEESFVFDFPKANQKVLFSVGFPYTQKNWEEFVARHKNNPHLKVGVLTKSAKGRPVEQVQVGLPGEGKLSVLVAARSHACEALASYVLEGFIEEALSDSLFGRRFREKYVLYGVPFLDKDGVEEGDQGKNRSPHDHNRDYGSSPIYPEIAAIIALAEKVDARVALDFHCPYLRGDIHEAYHWLGLKVPHVFDNAKELTAWLGEERPASANTAIVLLKEPDANIKTENIPFSWYFAQKENILVGMTLESPYAKAENVDEARAYGRSLLRALVRTEFLEPNSAKERGPYGHANLVALDKEIKSKKAPEAEAVAQSYLQNPAVPPVFRAQAHLSLATVLQWSRPDEAMTQVEAVLNEPEATQTQRAAALLTRATILCRSQHTQPQEIETALNDLRAAPGASTLNLATAYREAAGYYTRLKDTKKAIEYHLKRLNVAPDWEKSAALLQIASLLEAEGKKDEATARRKEAIDFLKPKLLPAPQGKSIHLGMMAKDYFQALLDYPDATQEERIEAAKILVNYPTLPPGTREMATQWLSEHGK